MLYGIPTGSDPVYVLYQLGGSGPPPPLNSPLSMVTHRLLANGLSDAHRYESSNSRSSNDTILHTRSTAIIKKK